MHKREGVWDNALAGMDAIKRPVCVASALALSVIGLLATKLLAS
jgi:hypothetical protein